MFNKTDIILTDYFFIKKNEKEVRLINKLYGIAYLYDKILGKYLTLYLFDSNKILP